MKQKKWGNMNCFTQNSTNMITRKEKFTSESSGNFNKIIEGTKIVGDVIADQNMQIDGEIKGNITTSAKIFIGENGVVNGNLTCVEAEIEGTINGTLSIEGLLTLRNTSKINGDIFTTRIQIDEGAAFNGVCNMGAKPTASRMHASPQNEPISLDFN